MNDWDIAKQFFSFNTADIWSQIIRLGACPRLCGMCGSVAGLWSLDANHAPPQLRQAKICPNDAKYSLTGESSKVKTRKTLLLESVP